jgi:hypothetical protein
VNFASCTSEPPRQRATRASGPPRPNSSSYVGLVRASALVGDMAKARKPA